MKSFTQGDICLVDNGFNDVVSSFKIYVCGIW